MPRVLPACDLGLVTDTKLCCPELQAIIRKWGSCLLRSRKYILPPGLFNSSIKSWVKELHQVSSHGYLDWRSLPISAAHSKWHHDFNTAYVSLGGSRLCLHGLQSASYRRVVREILSDQESNDAFKAHSKNKCAIWCLGLFFLCLLIKVKALCPAVTVEGWGVANINWSAFVCLMLSLSKQ